MDSETKPGDIGPQIVVDLETDRASKVDLTRDGHVVALVRPPRPSLHGSMRGSVRIPAGFDLTAPMLEDEATAESGRIHK